jgi:hypothetical protein
MTINELIKHLSELPEAQRNEEVLWQYIREQDVWQGSKEDWELFANRHAAFFGDEVSKLASEIVKANPAVKTCEVCGKVAVAEVFTTVSVDISDIHDITKSIKTFEAGNGAVAVCEEHAELAENKSLYQFQFPKTQEIVNE